MPTLIFNRDSSKDILEPQATFTVNPTPADSNVILVANGYTREGNSITVDPGTSVLYIVTKGGYLAAENTVTVNSDTTLSVVLEVDPASIQEHGIIHDTDLGEVDDDIDHCLDNGEVDDSTIAAINDLGQDLKYILYTQTWTPFAHDNVFLNTGKIISWVLSYDSTEEEMTTTEFPGDPIPKNSQEYLEWDNMLQQYIQPVTVTIQPTPSNARVVFTVDGDEYATTSITVNKGTTISYEVSLQNYSTESDTITVNGDMTIPVVLVSMPYTAGQVLFESNSPGNYQFTPLVPCVCSVLVVGGGGGGALAEIIRRTSETASSTGYLYSVGVALVGGGSGYVSETNENLTTNTYNIVVGTGGERSLETQRAWTGYSDTLYATGGTGGASSFGSITSQGGTGGYAVVSYSISYGGDFRHSVTSGTGENDADAGFANHVKSPKGFIVGSSSGGAGYSNDDLKGGGGDAYKTSDTTDPLNFDDIDSTNGGNGYVKVTFISYL